MNIRGWGSEIFIFFTFLTFPEICPSDTKLTFFFEILLFSTTPPESRTSSVSGVHLASIGLVFPHVETFFINLLKEIYYNLGLYHLCIL